MSESTLRFANRPEIGSIVSAMKIYTTLKKSRPKRFIMKKVRAFCNRSPKIFEIENSSKIFVEIFIENCMKMKIFEIENFRFFRTPKFLNAMRTQTDRAPRDFYEIASGQNVVKIMLAYFP